jgi:hypothetical protein
MDGIRNRSKFRGGPYYRLPDPERWNEFLCALGMRHDGCRLVIEPESENQAMTGRVRVQAGVYPEAYVGTGGPEGPMGMVVVEPEFQRLLSELDPNALDPAIEGAIRRARVIRLAETMDPGTASEESFFAVWRKSWEERGLFSGDMR